jgi:microcystin degradation protein MlrC
MARTLRSEIRPTQAAAFPAMAMNMERQSTDESPLRDLQQRLRDLAKRPGVLSTSVAMGFPYADVREMGTSAIVVTDDDPELARSLVDSIAGELLKEREQYRGMLISVDEALDMIPSLPAPVCLLDMGDNVGGGAPADGTILAHALDGRKFGPAFICICDPQAAQAAREAGVGATIDLSVGAKIDRLHGDPFAATFRVVSLHDGTFTETRPHHGGAPRFDMGPTAILETPGQLMVMLTSRRVPPFSLAQLTSCGLEPQRFKVIVAKGVHAPVAMYRLACPTLIRVNTPGLTTADMQQLTYRHRRRPLFPFET